MPLGSLKIAVRLTCITLALCLIADTVMMFIFPSPLRLFFYATLSGGLLAIIPSAGALHDGGPIGPGSRMIVAITLFLLVCLNAALVPLINGAPWPWDVWALGLDQAPAYYVIVAVVVGILSRRTWRETGG